ncbi:MAG: bifunctional glutamate N-acetyltransferase/amino-acid acetyltransferase ArgJ [Chloroflexi bacterium]|nr:bifunctional glutamate N-acetyltransferase/amino-acid acetyltransferase ArgJ [Chloroflexota bacterium]
MLDVLGKGTITTPRGFLAGAAYAGIKVAGEGKLDLGLLSSEAPCAAAGVFTTNRLQAAPVLLDRERLDRGRARAIVVNSGCANAATGAQGYRDAQEMTSWAAKKLGLAPEEVLAASTGVIGQPLPMDKIKTALKDIALSHDGGHALARAIMTTDTFPKEAALAVDGFTIGGIAKGSGMIHPNMATLLCFLATDAAVELPFLRRALRRAVDVSFNMITIDGDTSPNDSVLLLANGLAGNRPIAGGREGRAFQEALDTVCFSLARAIARDGEGATRRIEVRVEGAASTAQARVAARTIAGSSLVKTAAYGADPNWGRILAAAGRSGAFLDSDRAELYLGEVCVFRKGVGNAFDREVARAALEGKEVYIRLNLNLGRSCATAWGCDLTPEYVAINSEYMT